MEFDAKGEGRILVVDDEQSVGRMMLQWLRSEGYEVEYAPDFATVQPLMAQQAFDLVTLDIMMPGVDGMEILRWLGERYPQTGVIMATAIDRMDAVLEAMRGGAINYLLKPFNLHLVSEEIGRAMERQRLLAENRAYQQRLEEMVAERTRQLELAQERLHRQVRELEGRDRLVHFQMTPHSLQEAYVEVLEALKEVLSIERALIFRPTGRGSLATVAAMGFSAPGCLENESRVAAMAEIPLTGDAPEGRAFLQGKLVKGGNGYLAVPIRYREDAVGVLGVECDGGEEEEICNRLWRLSGEIALVLQRASVAEDLENGTLALGELANLE